MHTYKYTCIVSCLLVLGVSFQWYDCCCRLTIPYAKEPSSPDINLPFHTPMRSPRPTQTYHYIRPRDPSPDTDLPFHPYAHEPSSPNTYLPFHTPMSPPLPTLRSIVPRIHASWWDIGLQGMKQQNTTFHIVLLN